MTFWRALVWCWSNLTWKSQLYTYHILSEDPCSSDLCQIYQRNLNIPWRKFFFHDPYAEIILRLECVLLSQTEKNYWFRNVENFTDLCQKWWEIFFYHGEWKTFGNRSKTALSMVKEFNPLGIVNVLSSTVVKLYRAMSHLLRIVFCSDGISGLSLIRFTDNFASKDLIEVFESAVLLIR